MNPQTAISHELWLAVRRNYESQAWSNAILDAIYHLTDVIRSRTGLQSDGAALAGQAFGGKNPKLQLNKLQTETDRSIQAGAEQLLRGLYQAVRNPRSHERLADTQNDADAIVMFVSYLLSVIGLAKTAFSLEGSAARALDANFVPNERYASLVIEEIPPRQRLQVALTVFERRTKVRHEHLKFFFRAFLDQVPDEDRAEFFSAVSDELRDDPGDEALQFVLQILRPAHWLELTEVARLRSEHRLLKSLAGGYVDDDGSPMRGGLALLSREFWNNFTLKKEFLEAASAALASPKTQAQQYIADLVLLYLPAFADKPPLQLQRLLAKRINEDDAILYIVIKENHLWKLEDWHKVMIDSLKEYETRHPE